MRKRLLYAGAGITVLFALLHGLFWKLGGWHEQLLMLTPENSGIMQMLNVVSIYTLLFGAGVSLALAGKPTLVSVEKAFLLFMAGYYVLRIAFGFPFFGFSMEELVVWTLCSVVASCYLLAFRLSRQTA
ncbi:MAG: hypothetical protein PVI54_18330 [Desulfobacteraceae bacterium]|jgi:hypothetical protein